MQQETNLEVKNAPTIRIFLGIGFVFGAIITLFILDSFFNKTAANYHKAGGIVEALLSAVVTLFLFLLFDNQHQAITVVSGVLTQKKGAFRKSQKSIQIGAITQFSGFEEGGGSRARPYYGLDITDSTGQTLHFILNAFKLSDRRKVVAALQPMLANPAVEKDHDVAKTLRYWTDAPLNNMVGNHEYSSTLLNQQVAQPVPTPTQDNQPVAAQPEQPVPAAPQPNTTEVPDEHEADTNNSSQTH